MVNERSEIMLLVAGFAGSLVSVLSKPTNTLRESALAIIAGMSCAYFLTPLMFDVLNIDPSPNTQSAMAFLLGVLGMRTVELVVQKLFPDSSKGVTF